MTQITKTNKKRRRGSGHAASGDRRPRARPRTPVSTRPRRRDKVHPLVVVGAGVAALGLVAAVLSFGGDDGTSEAPSWAAVEISGGTLPAFSRGGPDPAVGMKAPEVRGTGLDGRDLVIAANGRRQVVLLLAHWCPHCRNEVPGLVAWWDEHGMPDAIDLYAVSTWADPHKPNFPPGRWLREERWPVRTLIDDEASAVGQAFGLRGTPFWVFLDESGRVIGRVEAELGGPGLDRALEMFAV